MAEVKRMFGRTRQPMAVCSAAALCLCLTAAGTQSQAAQALVLVNAVYPPFVNPPGHPRGEGIDIEIAREALRRNGLEIQVQLVPWKRALLMLERGDADFTTTISRNDKRDKFLAWTQAYRTGANYQFYSLKSAGLKLGKLEQLQGRSLGVVGGFYYPRSITEQAGLRVEKGIDISFLAKMLQAGRTEFFVVTAIAGAWEIEERGLGDVLEKQALEYTSDSPNYMAFSLARPTQTALDAMKLGLSSMKKDGSIAAIEKKYRRSPTVKKTKPE